MPNSASADAASCITFQSESEPMTTPTTGVPATSGTRPCYGSALEERRCGTRSRDHVVEFVARRRHMAHLAAGAGLLAVGVQLHLGTVGHGAGVTVGHPLARRPAEDVDHHRDRRQRR